VYGRYPRETATERERERECVCVDSRSFRKSNTHENLPLGGELWLLEVLHKGRYHAIVRAALEAAIAAVEDKPWLNTLRPGVIAVIERDLPLGELALFMLLRAEYSRTKYPAAIES
jgi:hypothetical protein